MSLVIVRNTETTILGYGELKLILTKSLNGTSFPLKYITYYLGFYINLISIERTTYIGIFLNRREQLLEDKTRKPICKLNSKSSIYLIRQDETTKTGYPSANYISYPLLISYLSLTSTLYSVNTITELYYTLDFNNNRRYYKLNPAVLDENAEIVLSLYIIKQLDRTID